MLNIVTWHWGKKYSAEYVRRLARGLRRHITQSHRFIVMTDRSGIPEFECHEILGADRELLSIKGCFARLRMFDPKWQHSLALDGAKRIVCIDLDTVICGPLDPLFNRTERFVILHGANAANPCPYTACLFMLQSGRASRGLARLLARGGAGDFAIRIPGRPGMAAFQSSGCGRLARRSRIRRLVVPQEKLASK